MSGITTHVLDVSVGGPASGIRVQLDRQTADGGWEPIGSAATDGDGRVRDLVPDDQPLSVAIHRLTFNVNKYFSAQNVKGFYHEITIAFAVSDPTQHYHVPLLLSPFGYSTYRGS